MNDSNNQPAAGRSMEWSMLHRFQRALSGPVAAGAARSSVRMPLPAEATLDGLRVMVADDNPLNLMLASEMLAQFGIEPLLAADGAEAVLLASKLPLDLILMDLQMPVLDGQGATQKIRRLEQEQARDRVPVVAYTSLSGSWAQLRAHGFDDALDKPCEVLAMRDCLVRWCHPRSEATVPTARAT